MERDDTNELERSSARLRHLAAASIEMTEAGTGRDVLDAATRGAREIVAAHQAVTSLTAARDWSQSITAVSLSERYGAWRGYDAAVDGSGIYALVCQENRPYRLSQAELEAHPAWRGFGAHAGEHPPMRGWLAVPLVGRDGTNLGLIQVSDRVDGADFDEQDELALVQLARLASAQVERLRQQERTQVAVRELERQHQLTATITENATSALFLMDERGHPTYQNAAARDLFGFELDEIAGYPLHYAIHHRRPDGSPYPMEECPIDRALPEERWVEPYEDLFLRKDGTLVPVAAAASPILRDGVPVGTVVEVRDLTTEKAAWAELGRQHELTRAITDNAVSALVFLDERGHPTYVNQAFVMMTGWSLDEIRDRPSHESIHHSRPDGTPFPRTECPIDRALPERRWVQPYEDDFIRKDGTFFPVRAAASPILEDGRPVGTVVEISDLTLERQMLAGREAAEARLRFIVEASEALARTFQTDEALQDVTDRAVPALADVCLVDLVEGDALRRVARTPGGVAGPVPLPVRLTPAPGDRHHPIVVAWRTGEAVMVGAEVDHAVRGVLDGPSGSAGPSGEVDVSAVLAVPIATAREVLGILTLAQTGGGSFDDGVLDTAGDLARRAATAIEGARLFERVEFQGSLLDAQGEASVDGLLVIGASGEVAWHNRRFREIWHFTEEDLARGDEEALRAAVERLEDPAAFHARISEVYAGSLVAHDELRFRDGRTIERYGAPLTGARGDRLGYFWSFRDITERKHAEERLAALYERERELSHRLQAGLLATALPPVADLSITSAYRPGSSALEVGGDWYDSFSLPCGRVAFAVGDVVGHGVDAAATMGQLRGALRALARTGEPAAVLDGMDQLLVEVGGSQMTTLAYVDLDPASGQLRYACAGHPPPLVVGADGRTRYLWDARSTPLGCAHGAPYTTGEGVLEPGDTLVLYTDGLIERRGESLDLGLDRLARTLNLLVPGSTRLSDDICDGLLAQQAQSDDVCVLAAHRPDGTAFGLTLSARRGELARLRPPFDRWLTEHGVDPQTRGELVLGVNEAVANSVEHGHEHDERGAVGVRARVRDATVTVTVTDNGRWRPPAQAGDRGRGILMMRAVADDVEFTAGAQGTTVTFVRSLDPGSG